MKFRISLSLLTLSMSYSVGINATPFTFVALPDTQVYSDNRFPDNKLPAVTDPMGTGYIFSDQTNWIVNNAGARNIKYVAHLGDIVQHGDDLQEWALAKGAMDVLLTADLPHGTVMGNHDDNHGADYRQNYLDNFGPDVFQDRAWYTASSPQGGANFQSLTHEDRKIGFLNFSIDQPQGEIDWASDIVEKNPDTMFIIGTHRYLYDFKLASGRYGESVDSPFGEVVVQDNFVDGVVEPNTGEDLFNEFVSQHPNIAMIHAGHFHSEWLRLDDQNVAGQQIIQILTDYQEARNGGDGYLRIYELDFDNNKFSFETYSTTLDRNRSTLDHFVETIAQAFLAKDALMEALDFSELEYMFLISQLKDTVAPDGFLYLHPDYDESAERAYYDKYLNDLFLGNVPVGVGSIADWEGLWLQAFAANPANPFDFSDWVRSPSGSMFVDFSSYSVPVPPLFSLFVIGLISVMSRARLSSQ